MATVHRSARAVAVSSKLKTPEDQLIVFSGHSVAWRRCALPQEHRGNAHQTAWHAVAEGLKDLPKDAVIVEVARRVPWGFYELGQRRQNMEVQQFLGAEELAARTQAIILHILVGEGESRTVWRNALTKACHGAPRRVLILEHNANSADWSPDERTKEGNLPMSSVFTSDQLSTEVQRLCPGRQLSACLVEGRRSSDRNLLIVVK